MDIPHAGAAERLRALPTRLVNQVALVANRASERALEPTGSRRHHYALLATLAEFGPASQAELGRRTRIDRSDIVAAVNDLAERGSSSAAPIPPIAAATSSPSPRQAPATWTTSTSD